MRVEDNLIMKRKKAIDSMEVVSIDDKNKIASSLVHKLFVLGACKDTIGYKEALVAFHKLTMKKFNDGKLNTVKEIQDHFGTSGLYETWASNPPEDSEEVLEAICQMHLWGTYGKHGRDKFSRKKLVDCESSHLANLLIDHLLGEQPLSFLTKFVILNILTKRYKGFS